MPYRLVANKPLIIQCHRKCGNAPRVRFDRIRDAYRDTASTTKVITLPLSTRP